MIQIAAIPLTLLLSLVMINSIRTGRKSYNFFSRETESSPLLSNLTPLSQIVNPGPFTYLFALPSFDLVLAGSLISFGISWQSFFVDPRLSACNLIFLFLSAFG
ncbi:MAG: hypothetical protein WBA74_27485, partial [Cyclobacteriaceae bacterium]